MAAPYPFGFMGNGVTRCVVLALPSSQVCRWLPAGLELGVQSLTPEGTHPVIFLFHRFSECQFSFPTILPSMNFHEQTAGIPFTYVRENSGLPCGSGPYYFMPKLYLDDTWVLLNGRFWWGFNKEMASVYLSDSRYTVTSLAGQRLVSLEWSADGHGGDRAVTGYLEFEPVRQMLSQTLISAVPVAVGPFFALTDFERRWNLTTVKPLRSVLEIDPSYMPNFEGGYFVAPDQPGGVDSVVRGSFELSGPWWLSAPYGTMVPAGASAGYAQP